MSHRDRQADTILALASAAGRAGVAVIRISGPAAGAALESLTGRRCPPPRTAALATLRHPGTGEWLDQALTLWFPEPASFTGQPVAECHIHGGRAVVQAVTDALLAVPGLRLAEPGEFSRRAFENGKLDLTEAEGLADLVAAETAAQRRQALRQMQGALGRTYDGWSRRLIRSLAHVEAEIDFSDEALPVGLGPAAWTDVRAVGAEIRNHLDDGRAGERLRDGLTVVITGAPNVGKSSLLNALARRDAAIVSTRAGTTRDVIEIQMDLDGYPICLADTAGLRPSTDEIEVEGIRRARDRAVAADLKLAVFDAVAWPALDPETLALVDDSTIPVVNKQDLNPIAAAVIAGRLASLVSATTGSGLAALQDRLSAAVAENLRAAESPSITRTRHRRALEECQHALSTAPTAALPELAAEDLRIALRCLGRITGRVDVEDLLDVIFRDFCIGK